MILGLFLLSTLFIAKESDRLYAYIKAVVSWNIVMYVSLECFSVFGKVSALTCGVTWALLDVILILILKKKGFFSFWKSVKWKNLFSYDHVILGTLAAATLFFALKTVPNNFDSMTYHLPRIMQWAQNGSIAHYASSVIRQISSPVLAEFINLHVYLLSGKKDFLFHVPQWAAYITNTFLVMGIAGKLKCHRFTCFAAGLLFMTMPMAFAQSMTTQNDLLAAMWYLAIVYVMMDLYACDALLCSGEMIERTVVMSLCVAFGYLTKPSGMFIVLVFGIGLLVVCVRRKDKITVLFQLFFVAAFSAGAVVAPELIRNFCTFHAFSDPIAGAKQLVGTLEMRYLFVNFLKNFFFNIPNVYWDISSFVEHAIYYVAYLLGVNINAPEIAEEGAVFAMNPARTYHHDTALNPVVFYGAIIGFIYLLYFMIKRKLDKLAAFYVALAGLSMVTFCVFLRWERFIERYTITYLALLCPIIALFLQRLLVSDNRMRYAGMVSGIILFVSFIETVNMIPYHFVESAWNSGIRDVEYFHNWKEEKYDAYNEITTYVKEGKYLKVGLRISEISYEYPIWALLSDTGVIMKHLDVQNATGVYEDADFIPDCIIIDKEVGITSYEYHGVSYIASGVGDDYTYLLVRE